MENTGKQINELIIVVVLATMGLLIPWTSSAFPGAHEGGPIVSAPELNLTGVNITNQSIPSRYGIPPTPIDVKVELSGTGLPGPKGEMAAGPRTIGFSANPLLFAILVVAIVAGAAGAWYLVRRKPE